MRISMMPLILLAACAPTPRDVERSAQRAAETQQALDAELAGFTPGQPSECLPTPPQVLVNTRIYGDTIVYRVSNDLKFRNDTSGGCDPDDQRSFIRTRAPTGRVCRGDIAESVDRSAQFTTGSCALGAFVPYRRP